MKSYLLFLMSVSALCFLSGCGGSSGSVVRALAITSGAPPSGTQGVAYNGSQGFSPSASGGMGPYTWSWAAAAGSSLPPGLSLSTSTGAISGTPTAAGSYSVVMSVTDSESPAVRVSVAYTITVSGPAMLSITSGAPPAGTVSVAYGGSSGFPLVASGGMAPYTWNWTAAAGSALPPGLVLSGSSITGTPTLNGSYNVTVTVTDSQTPAAQTSASYTIIIGSAGPLTITSGLLPNGAALKVYGDVHRLRDNLGQLVPIVFFQLSASGGSGNYTWSWAAAQGSSLPPGLGCCAHFFETGFPPEGVFVRGAVFGVPTTPGTYNVVLTLTDAQNPSARASANYSVLISLPPPPTINATPLPAIGTLNSPYVGFTLTATNGYPPLIWSESGALPPGMTLSSGGVLSGTPTAAGSFPIAVSVKDSGGQNGVSPQNFTIEVLAKGFVPTGSMAVPRAYHTATLFADGKVLVTGDDPTAEIFNPTSGSFTMTGNPVTQRGQHTATSLSDGKVLVAGGIFGAALATAELYDETSGTFTATKGNMESTRFAHTATLLKDGRVLIAGGTDEIGNTLATAELFDESTGTFTSTGSMASARSGHTATLLNDGRVLVTGGYPLATAEIYDPATGKFTATGSMATWRFGHTATLLSDGRVVVIAGQGGADNNSLATAEIYDPTTSSFSVTKGNLGTARRVHTAVLLGNGQVLVAGGIGLDGVLSSAELFDPGSGTFATTADMTTARWSHTATVLNDGTVLVTGGYDANGSSLASAELYQ